MSIIRGDFVRTADKAEYRARPIEERLHGSAAKAYKPTHGGYPG